MLRFSLSSWLQTASLLLRRQQLYALTIILTIGLTVGALLATFQLNYQLLFAPLPYKDAPQLQLLRGSLLDGGAPVASEWLPSQASLDLYRQSWPGIESKALHNISLGVEQNLPDNPTFQLGYVTPEFLPMFDAPLALGRHLNPDEGLDSQVPVAVLSYAVWQQHFALDPQVLDKTLTFRGVSFKVVGVLAENFVEPVMAAPGWFTEVWLSFDFHNAGTGRWNANNNQRHLLLKLAPGTDPRQLTHDLQQWAAPQFQTAALERPQLHNHNIQLRLESVRSRILGDASKLSLSLLAGSALLCAIALANIANLVLSRAMAQQRSLTIRIALGARPQHLFRQYLMEFSVLALPAFVLCLLVAQACFLSLKAGYACPLPRLQELGSSTASLLLTAVSLLLWCLALAAWLTRQLNYSQLQQGLQQSGKGASVQVSKRTRQLLLMSQTLFCLLTLIYCSQIFLQTFSKLQQPTGLNLHNYQIALNPGALLETMTATERRQHYIAALEQVKTHTNATSAGLGYYPPISYWLEPDSLDDVRTTADLDSPALRTQVYAGDDGYLKTLGLQLQSGGFFSPAQVRAQEPVVLISESLARAISPDADVLDKALYLQGATTPVRIVGVVKDLHLPNQTATNAIYRNFIPSAYPFILLQMPEGREVTRAQVNQALALAHPQLKVSRFNTSTEILADHTKEARVAAVVTAALSLLALALAGLGIFTVIRTQIQLRQYELAVRQSLGARPQHLLQLTLVDSLKPLLWAVLVLAVGYSALQLSQNFGWVFGFAEQLQIAPLNAALALLTVLTLTVLIVLGCIRPLSGRAVIQSLRGQAVD
ncbi:MAG: ABC transporter permease [Gammaproteobacteria bacterium]|nr:ABC transporter permease [Gammaproteobacteria bacterium]MBU2058150.1 ABC transporter permease [Gammaproteobacteria bacterium]MBU2173486.1 ABC transporter permease [Gammaproteobacteria bacterium]MBU2248776.1 ABC transporter permease [Gammaproteobacteria bacterium]MBU2342696.1 ABC transporter permease [Gammaproteobacteria bacterium]